MKARVCPNCDKHNAESAWHCADCGTTLSTKTVMDVEEWHNLHHDSDGTPYGAIDTEFEDWG